MPRLLRHSFWIAAAVCALVVTGCDKGAARQCDERFGCPPPQVCDFGSNQCVGENDDVTCSTNDNCADAGDNKYCDLTNNKCVACLNEGSNDECPNRLVCEKTKCIPCQEDSVCDGSLCLRDGGCAAPQTIAYVAQDGTVNATCSAAMPCTLPAALATDRAYVRVLGNLSVTAAVVLDRSVSLYGGKQTRTTITRSTPGPIFDVSGAGAVELRDLELFGASGAGGDAIVVSSGAPALDLENVDLIGNAGLGLSAGAASLRVTQSLVVSNSGGGISAAGTVFLENDIVAQNGAAGSAVGGLRLTSTGTTNVIRYNTIADNLAAGAGSGVACASAALRLSSNIFAGNTVATCTTAYSLFPTGTAVTGTMDKAGDPKFITTMLPADRDLPTFYHLMAGSDAIGGGETLDEVTSDIDGDPRPAARAIGADERYE